MNTNALTCALIGLLTLGALGCKTSAAAHDEPQLMAGSSQEPVLLGSAASAASGSPHEGIFVVPTTITLSDDSGALTQQAAEDCLSIAFESAERVAFDLTRVYDYGHYCAIEGIATRESADGPYVFRDVEDELDCTIHLIMEEGAVRVVDVNGGCQSYYCGARAGELGTSVALSYKVEDTSQINCALEGNQ